MTLRSILCVATSAVALGCAGAAFAQETPQADNVGTDDIIVTAQFRAQNLQDTPLAITAVSGDTLEARGITSIDNVGKIAPNVNISTSSAVHGPAAAIYIRGIGQFDSNPAFEPGVGVYFDDVYHGTVNGSFVDLFDIERVEVLRGPQGTLSGKNSIGGSVKIYTKKPLGNNEGYLEAGYGTDNKILVRGAFDASLIKDQLFLRVSAMHQQQDGYVDLIDYACANPGSDVPPGPVTVKNKGCKTGTLGGKNVSGIAAALRWVPADGWDVTLRTDMVRDSSQVTGLQQVRSKDPRFISPSPFKNYSNFKDFETGEIYPNVSAVDSDGIALNIDGKLADNLSIQSITAYRNMRADYSNDQEGGNPFSNRLNYNHMRYHQFSQELRLSGTVGSLADWTVGGYYFDSYNNLANRIASSAAGVLDILNAPAFPLNNVNNNDRVDNSSKSVFGHLVVHATDSLNFIGGIRYTKDEKTYQFRQFRAWTDIPAPNNGLSAEFKGDHVDYRLGVDYRFNRDLMVYAQWSTGYKGGGTNPRPINPTQIVSFNPEFLDSYEVGFKSDLFDRTLRLNMAAFYSKYKDIILVDSQACCGNDPANPPAPFGIVPRNAGDATIKGLEAEINWEPVDRLIFTAGGGLLDFKYTSLTGLIGGPAPGVDPFITPYTAKFNANAGISYGIELSDGSILTPRVDMTHQGRMYSESNDAATSLIKAFTLFNAAIAWKSQDKNWTASLNVTNLGNKTYYTSAFDATAFNGDLQHAVARKRQVFFSIRRNF